MVVNLEIGMVTPPVGLNLFVTSGITGMSIMQVARAAFPWLSVLLVFLVIVTYVPQLSLWLPNWLF
jgi:C4-dicarboxylate transporter DctM subunit